MRPWVKWGIVTDGRIRWTSECETGDEVFRDDVMFNTHKRDMINSYRVFNWCMGIAGLFFLLAFYLTIEPFMIVLMAMFWGSVLLTIGEVVEWRTLLFGTVIYQLGVLVFQIKLIGTHRVFIPFDQVKDVKRSSYYIDIYTGWSFKKFRISLGELGEPGTNVLMGCIKDDTPSPGPEPPKLVLYSAGGVWPQDAPPNSR
jgi:hypothetical protein